MIPMEDEMTAACRRDGWIRNPFARSFGDTAWARIDMEDGSRRWEEIDMRPSGRHGEIPTISRPSSCGTWGR